MSDDLYWRLHSLSEILEDSGFVDEFQHPDAYATILDAMAFVRGTPQPAAQQPHRSGCTAGTDEECVQRGCGTNCPAVSPRQGVAYAALPEPDLFADCDSEGGFLGDTSDVRVLNTALFRERSMRAFADATHALRASHGQAPAGAGEPTEQQILEAAFAPAQPAVEASRFGSPELQAMIIARCVEKDQADNKKKDPL